MSDENAFNQAADEYAYCIRNVLPDRIAHMPKQPESPIERAFLIGLMSMSHTVPCYDFGDSYSRMHVTADYLPTIKVEVQAEVLQYRADFLLNVMSKGELVGRVVVECDGHDFHERTKEQAARDRSRDRAMVLAGYKVMRFTGSEIHRDLMKCVTDAHYAAWHCYTGGADE